MDRVPGPPISWVYDVVRGSVFCSSEAAIITVLGRLQGWDPAELSILRLKNRFKSPTPAGFRDVNMNVVLRGRFVAEIQVHHEGIKAFEAAHHSHSHYEVGGTHLHLHPRSGFRAWRLNSPFPSNPPQYFRSFFRGGVQAVDQRLQSLRDVGREGTDCETLDELVASVVAAGDVTRMLALSTLLDFLQEGRFRERVLGEVVALLTTRDEGKATLVAALVDLAKLQAARGESDAATGVAERALRVQLEADAARGAGETEEAAVVQATVAEVMAGRRFGATQARAQYREALAAFGRCGAAGPAKAKALLNAAKLELAEYRGDLPFAEACLTEATGIFTRMFGEAHPDSVACLQHTAQLREKQGRTQEARRMFEEALVGVVSRGMADGGWAVGVSRGCVDRAAGAPEAASGERPPGGGPDARGTGAAPLAARVGVWY
jgi:tetratricopeptide (TPR) repeat protein